LKIKRYYGLRLVSLIYKVLAMLASIFIVSAVAFITIEILNTPMGLRTFQRSLDWLIQFASLFIGGGLLALTFYVLAQLVDIQVEQTNHLRHIAKSLSDQNELIKTLKVDQAANRITTYPRPSQIANIQTNQTP
jgi:hypothetical protein